MFLAGVGVAFIAESTALLYLALRCGYRYPNATQEVIPYRTYDPETREYYIALFLSLYLLSMWSRTNGVLCASPAGAASQPAAPAGAAGQSVESTSPNQPA
ncbi:hypothetical protein [Methyloversatilis sp.]|uniref:hypothetical protein n=1 Tax=Methyloversatilis sp. TaxID=2569862 RepID=UPI0027358E98|nr:hypothetical protein [Methyloversatilis sp.]MDP2870477.1 hypothetical protein [Methyloversatilis sp.]MDP3457454.1 hypothetical protein [Methyloversatilis sp.]MDP3576527.1 hypothetical protein [Methyloversatilis sp.]